MADLNNFWSSRSRVQSDSANMSLPPLDSNNFFTSNNFLSSLPSETEDSNRAFAQSRHRVEVDGDDEIEDSNRNERQPTRQTETDGSEEMTDNILSRDPNVSQHVVDGIGDWEDSNRLQTGDSLVSQPGQRRAVVSIDGNSNDFDLKPVNQLYPSRAIRDTDDNTAGTMSGTFHYVHNEPPSQSLITANSDSSFSVPSIDSRKQLIGKVVRKVETDSPLVDPLLRKSMKKPEIETAASGEDSTEKVESQLSVVTQETGDTANDLIPSLALHSSVGSYSPADSAVLHSLPDSEVVAAPALSTNLASRSNPSGAIQRSSPRGKASQFSAIPVVQLPATVAPSLPKQRKNLLPSDNTLGGSLPSRLQNRGINSSSFPSSAPSSPSYHFSNESSRPVSHVKPSIEKVVADSPHPVNANTQRLPSIHGLNQRLSPGLVDTPETLPLPLSSSYPLPQGNELDFEQPLSLPSYINDNQYGAPLHQHGSYCGPSRGSQFSDLDPPMSLPASGVNNNFFSSQPGLQSLHTSGQMMGASKVDFTGMEPIAAGETADDVRHVSDGSEEFNTPLTSLGKESKPTSLIRLVQQYMQEKSDQILTCPPPSTMQMAMTSTSSAGHQHDSDNLMKKELEKAFERISDLEVRVQDLTLQLTVELPDDNEITHLSMEKLQQEYKRMKELKRRAEQQNIEARMASQRMIAENHRLKEELAQIKGDRQAILQQLLELRKDIHSRQQDANKKAQSMKMAVTLALTDGGYTGSLSLHSVTAAAFPSMTITMDVFSSIIASETVNYSSSLIITFGQAGAGKTSLLRAIDNLAGVPVTPRGQQSSLQVYEILTSMDVISTETKWSPQPVQGYITKLLATMVAKSCSKKKRSPSFDVDENTEGRPAPPQTKVDFYQKKVYESVKRVVETMEDNGQLSDLNISIPSSLTFFDLGSDSAATLLLPHLLGQGKPPVLLDAVNLEEIQSSLLGSRVGSLTQEDEAYTSLTSEELPLKLSSQLQTTLEFAKSLQQQNSGSAHPITLIIACMHTDSFARGKNVQDMVRKLKYRLVLDAAEKGIMGNFDLYTVSVCQNDSYGYDNASLVQLKRTVENAARNSGNELRSGEIPARWMLLQGVLQDLGKHHLSLVEVARYGRECGIILEEELHQFLALQHESGNLLYLPHARSQLLRSVVITDVVRLLEKILRLFYYQRQLIEVGSNTQTSLPPSGISDSTLRNVVQEDSDVIIHLLTEFKLCETDVYQGMEKSYTLFPQLF